jgi:polysaccharide export outer membrane protein
MVLMRERAFALLLLLLWVLPSPSLVAQRSPVLQPSPDQPLPQSDTTDPTTSELWGSGRYRLTAGDVIELTFPYVPEFDQVLTVQPDGYVTLRAGGDLRVQGRTLPELRKMLFDTYEPILREPVITIVLKEFEKPFFIVAGQVKQPGKFDLRGALTVTQGLAVAGGIADGAKHSQVILFRRYTQELLEVKEVNVKKMLASKDLSEDPLLRQGDTLFVPKSALGRIKQFIPVPGIGMYLNPLAW